MSRHLVETKSHNFLGNFVSSPSEKVFGRMGTQRFEVALVARPVSSSKMDGP